MEPLSVLLVDDDVDFGAMMKLRLSREAPRVSFHFVAGGSECLEFVTNNTVDCILSDFQMPGMSGMELMRRLKEKGMDVPFIFLTGQGSEEVARDAFKDGADDYFTKDMGFAHFARIINSVKQAVKKRRAELSRRKAEAALLHEKTFTDAVVNSLPGMFYLVDDHGRLVMWNRRYQEAAGKRPDEMKQMNALDYVAEESKALAASRMMSVLTRHEECLDELYAVDKDGKKAPYLCSGSPVVIEGRTYLVGMAIDFTERDKAESDMARSVETLKTILNSVSFGMMVVNRDRTIRMANKAALDLMGYSDQADIVGKTCHNVVCPAEAGRCPVLDLGLTLDLSERVLLKKGGERMNILKSVSPIKLGDEEVLLETFVTSHQHRMAA